MAEQGFNLDPETLGCSICLDLLKDPVIIPCGHRYCMSCIRHVWDEEGEKKSHSCPQCAQTFLARPDLVRNTTLADLVEELKAAGLQADRSCAGPGDVACDPHQDPPTLEKHTLVSLTEKRPENVSYQTREEFARHLCPVDAVSAAAERTERQRELEASRLTIQQRIQSREKGVRVLQLEAEALNRSADKAVDDSEEIFAGLIGTIERQRREVKMQIRSRQKTEVSRVAEIRDKLEEEIADLRRKDGELQQLSQAPDDDNDDPRLLHRKPSLTRLGGPMDLPSYTRPLRYVEDVTAAVSEVRDKLHRVLHKEWPTVSRTATGADAPSTPPEPATRAVQRGSVRSREYHRYSRDLTLDPNTVHTHVLLSEGNRKATLVKKTQLYHWHPDRFLERWQVLSKEGLTGRCYWEVKRSGVEVLIAVAYKDISRSGTFDTCVFGNNSKSWGLASYKNGYQFKHSNIRTPVSGPQSSRLGVYLDHGAGILSFYSVSETMTLLHRVQTTFTQPLHVGFWLPNTKGDTVELC
uniref:Tripartite motif-containing protein 16-like n=1 Tax=Cyclopterus lumpus TaxID=8103 RepID=A0A8C3AK55_CYCLU